VARKPGALEGVASGRQFVNLQPHYRNKNVLVTGHTGFKGAWLTEWLLLLGARVTGYSLGPPTNPALFDQLGLRRRIRHLEADIRDGESLHRAVLEIEPDFVFHLAAQSLVRRSYAEPRETFDVNVMGTISLLEALRGWSRRCAVVLATTDKVYAPREAGPAHSESDPLGGHDPYSASKAAAEIAIAAYRRSYFFGAETSVRIASGRSGNVIGGGDWGANRIVPDCIRSLRAGDTIVLRHPTATRPWQFVLEPLSGYLELAAKLFEPPDPPERLSGAFNFGPAPKPAPSVTELVTEILKYWPGQWLAKDDNTFHEAAHLALETDKAARLLNWSVTYDFATAVRETAFWYRQSNVFAEGDTDSFVELTRQQIVSYEQARESKACTRARPA
jgi:CDP-glucose 4,6-dehydratase